MFSANNYSVKSSKLLHVLNKSASRLLAASEAYLKLIFSFNLTVLLMVYEDGGVMQPVACQICF